MKNLPSLFLLFVIATPLIAQVSQERQILVIPRAEHPQIAKDSGLGGRVTVYVTVNQAGNVISVGNVIGPDDVCSSVNRADVVALRESAKAAAVDAKFATGSGELAMSIPLTFNFPKGKGERVFSILNHQSATTSETPTPGEYTGPVNAAPTSTPSANREVYTVKAERSLSTANPPPDYAGPAYSAANTQAASASGGKFPEQISGGVLNGKAVNLPKPPFPPAARAVQASGAVSVQVLVDEQGSVFSAAAVSGHPLLRAASRDAACSASFSPTMLSGTPVRVSGVIVYNFVP